MKKTFIGVLLVSIFTLTALVMDSNVSMADTITSGSSGQIHWTQSQNFNLDKTFKTICYSDTVEGCSRETDQETHFSQTSTLSFHGAPSGFTIGDTKYSLTGANLNFLYSVHILGVAGCSDNEIGRECGVAGQIKSYGYAQFPSIPLQGQGQKVYARKTREGQAHDDGFSGSFPWYPNYASGASLLYIKDEMFQGITREITLDYSSPDFLTYFAGVTTVDLDLTKYTDGYLWGADPNDNWDILRESGTAAQNTLGNTWSGRVNLQYIYNQVVSPPEAPTNPVPEPATMILFGTGIAGLIAVRRRKKVC